MPYRFKMVICDDDADELLFFQMALRSLGLEYDLHWIPDGSSLIKYLDRAVSLPEFIFLDIDMPGPSGLQCLSHLQRKGFLHKTTVVVHSSSVNAKDVETAYSNGASCYLVKPYDIIEFRRLLNQILYVDLKKNPFAKKEFCLAEPGRNHWPYEFANA